jgi:hypothetical protein
MAHVESTAAMRSCIDACQACHAVCLETVKHCLAMGGRHAEAEHITTLLDCAQICATSADFMLRGSASHTATCLACAEVCETCAESCDALDGAEMKRCADECRRCAEECRKMAASAA